MAGHGPAPKDPSKRARKNSDPIPLRVVDAPVTVKPELPEFNVAVTIDDEIVYQPFEWPEQTRQWWADLDSHPLKDTFFETDWSYLLDTARLHAEFWLGNLKLAPELRLREAKYGFTPEDRARLRIQVAQAIEGETRAATKVSSARERAQGVKRN